MISSFPRIAGLACGLVSVLLLGRPSLAQTPDADARPVEVFGSVTVTTKGISLIPAFTLGRPAMIFDLAVRKHGFAFEPQYRTDLQSRPWSLLLWGRYRTSLTPKLRLTVGAHPAVSFRIVSAGTSGSTSDVIEARRYVAAEANPAYSVSNSVNLGVYYLYSRGVDPGTIKTTHFLSARPTVANIRIGGGVAASVTPQLYYLQTGGRDGVYVGSMFSVSKPGVPVSIAGLVNKDIHSDVAGGQGFLWNISAVYTLR